MKEQTGPTPEELADCERRLAAIGQEFVNDMARPVPKPDERVWRPQFFQSGTCIVTTLIPRAPHLYVYGPLNPNDIDDDRQRMKMCYELADLLNGGNRPAWLDDMERRSEDSCDDLDGSSIRATGPSIDIDPPNLNWREDESDEAKDARARLMDRLFGLAEQLGC